MPCWFWPSAFIQKNHYRHSHHITIRLCRPHSHWTIYHNQIYTISLLNNYSKITFTFSLIRPQEGDAHFCSQREDWHWPTSLSGPQLRSMVEKCRTDYRQSRCSCLKNRFLILISVYQVLWYVFWSVNLRSVYMFGLSFVLCDEMYSPALFALPDERFSHTDRGETWFLLFETCTCLSENDFGLTLIIQTT